jgi:glycosyltransferase involved in cell wall biosynthesis
MQILTVLMVTRENLADRRYGLGKSLLPVAQALELRGHVVSYLCQADMGEKAKRFLHNFNARLAPWIRRLPEGEQLVTLVWGILERFNMGRLAAKVAARDGYGLVHCHDPLIAWGFRLFRHFSSAHACRWGVTEHGFGCYAYAIHEDGVRLGGRLMRWMRKREANTLRAAAWVIAPTQASLNQLARDLCVYPVPLNWQAVSHPRPQLNLYSRNESRRELGWGDEVFYVLGIGRIAPLKQFPMLIEACSRLIRRDSVQLVLLGDGDYDALQTVAVEMGLVRPVIFAVTDDVGLYLSAADVYASTSATESFGMANLEALLAGTPSVCTAVGGVPEVVGDAAWLVPAELGALVGALQTLREDDRLRAALGERGRRRGEAWPDVENISMRYEQIYRKALAE